MSAVVAVLLVGLADETVSFLPSGTLESFRADLGLTYAQAGTVLAVVAPGAVVGGAFAAAADRASRRAIAAGGALAYAASLVAFASARSFALLAGAAFVLGVASTAMVDAAEVALVDLAGGDLRRYLARSNLLATVGDLAGPALVAGVAASGLSWRLAFAVAAALMTLYAAALAVAPLPAPAPSAGDGDTPRSRLAGVVRDPAVWVVGAIGLLMAPFDEPLVGFTIALLQQERGASASVATAVAAVGLSGGMLSYTVLARRFEAVADRRLLLGSLCAMAAGAAATAAAPTVALVALAALVTSVGLNLGWLALQHRSLTLRPGEVGTTKAVLGVVEVTGFWIPIAIGALADAAGLVPAVGAYGVLGAVVVVLAWWDGRRRGRGAATASGPAPPVAGADCGGP